jgi:hypothetical protein
MPVRNRCDFGEFRKGAQWAEVNDDGDDQHPVAPENYTSNSARIYLIHAL